MGPTQNMPRHISFAHQGNAGANKWDPDGKLYFPVMQSLETMLPKQTLSDAMQGECFVKAEAGDQHI